MLKSFLKSCSAAAIMTFLAVGAAAADDLGKQEFMTYCASCHGETAMGGGEVAKYMTVDVPDLTTIAQRNDGVFPFLEVMHMVDGRSGLMPHGSAMPVWGDRFSNAYGETMAGDLSAVLATRGRIVSLVSYLESIQK